MKLVEHILGFIILSLGIVFVLSAELGAGSMDAFNYYVSALLSKHISFFTVGRVAILNGMLAIVLSYIITKDYKTIISFIFIFIVGNFIDLWLYLFNFVPDILYETLVARFILASIGVIIIGFGAAITVSTGYPPSPFESLLLALDKKINHLAISKIIIDSTYLLLAFILGFIYQDVFKQIGFFTIVLTLFTGFLVKHFSIQIHKYKHKKGENTNVIKQTH